ncbi:MAG TPA: hypothetical protein VJO33_16010, partial [Gemmatimonadaceae bacterium]|nr:hypothetical protein [Gemmatimonadaceae bacterium]
LEKSSAGIAVEVVCRLQADMLVVEISDDGAAPDTATMPEGVGLGNTRARLAELYGKRATLSIAPRHSRGMCFTLAIPIMPTI